MTRRAQQAVAVVLVLAGFGALVCGVGAWMVSGCCGSPEPSQPGYLVLGALGAGAGWALAAQVVRRR